MKRRHGSSLVLVMTLALFAGALHTPIAAAKSLSEEQLLGTIEKGGTAADHAALASYYRDQAKAAEKKAADHEAWAEKYGAVMGKADWPTHCRALVSYYRKLAEEYEAMAKLHEGHAAELRKK